MGTQKQSIIEVNGKRYDARTGQLISDSAPIKIAKAATKPVVAKKRPLVQDFAKPRAVPANHIQKKVQPSRTLMRTAVKKPAPKPVVKKTVARTVSDFKPIKSRVINKGAILPSKSEAQRLARAEAIKQNRLVSKFAASTGASSATLPVSVAPLTVQPAPKVALPAHKQNSVKNPVESIIERGLRNATSHNEKFEPKSKRRSKKRSKLVTYSAGALAAILLVGFVAYQNIPNIAVRYAAARAGVKANLPGYQPAGFALGSRIQYNPGQITLSYSSNTDDRGFTITQRESNWNSDTLMSNYVASKSEQVQTYEDKGRTIYLYGESNATWISGGIWYDIDGKSLLNSDQLIRIATSM